MDRNGCGKTNAERDFVKPFNSCYIFADSCNFECCRNLSDGSEEPRRGHLQSAGILNYNSAFVHAFKNSLPCICQVLSINFLFQETPMELDQEVDQPAAPIAVPMDIDRKAGPLEDELQKLKL